VITRGAKPIVVPIESTPKTVVAILIRIMPGFLRCAPIGEWDAEALGVHRSITVEGETGLTPYLLRPHDAQLRARLAEARNVRQASIVVLVGGSCTGKTRTLYEAVAAELGEWRLVAPRNDTELAQLLVNRCLRGQSCGSTSYSGTLLTAIMVSKQQSP
jgi:hypothetical protein